MGQDRRPHVKADADEVSKLKSSGMSVRAIARDLGIGVATVHRLLRGGVPKGSPDGGPETPGIEEAA